MIFTGIFIEQSTGARAYTAPSGFVGISLEYPTGIRFIRVTDFRGNPIAGCLVTVQNTTGDYEQTTDSLGNAAIEVETSGTTQIIVSKNKTTRTFSYIYASELPTKTIILQPRLML